MIAWVDQNRRCCWMIQIKKIRIAVINIIIIIPKQMSIVIEKMTKQRRLGISMPLKGTHLRRF